jgi:hypothetical protein
MHPYWESVWTDDPPLDVSGMTLVKLNPLGRLTQFVAVPPQVEKPAGAASPPDWAPLFSAAGLDPSKWPPAQPTWTPPVDSDARAAWTGSLAERPNIPMRIEAAAYRGKPVYFELIGPWTRPGRMQPYQPTCRRTGGSGDFHLFCCFRCWWAGVMLARRNLRLGRGDRRGASRLAAFVFAAWAVAWLFGAHHVPNFDELGLFMEFLAWGLFFLFHLGSLHCSGALCAPPLARHAGLLEPLAGGRFSGSTGGTRCAFRLSLWGVLYAVRKTRVVCSVLARLSSSATILGPISGSFWARAPSLLIYRTACSLRSFLACVSVCPGSSPGLAAQGVGGRSRMGSFVHSLRHSGVFRVFPLTWWSTLIFLGLAVFLLIRFGLLTLWNYVFYGLLHDFPLTTQGSAWYAGISLAGILLMAAIALYGFYTSLGGRPVFGGAVLEE